MKRRGIMTPRRLTIALTAAGLLLLASSGASAQNQVREEKIPIMGTQLMTEQERDQYRIAMRALKTEEERAAMRARHQKEIRARAKEQGVELSELRGPRGPRDDGVGAGKDGRVRGRDLMTPEEREQRRQGMRSKASAEERERSRKENHEKMRVRARVRARERGVELSDESRRGGGAGQRHGQGRGDPR
jgi:hypothetical protein